MDPILVQFASLSLWFQNWDHQFSVSTERCALISVFLFVFVVLVIFCFPIYLPTVLALLFLVALRVCLLLFWGGVWRIPSIFCIFYNADLVAMNSFSLFLSWNFFLNIICVYLYIHIIPVDFL